MRLRFLSSPDLIRKYSMGECQSLARSLADKLQGEIVAVGSPVFEGYYTMHYDKEDMYFAKNKNPIHYACKVNNTFIDIYGIYNTSRDFIAHCNYFYKTFLPDIDTKIDIRFWKVLPENLHELCEDFDYWLVPKIVDNIDKKGFLVFDESITNEEFARAMEIVHNSYSMESEGNFVSYIGESDLFLDSNGFVEKLDRPYQPIEMSGDVRKEVLDVVLCIPMELLNEKSVVEPWYHAVWNNPYSILGKSDSHVLYQSQIDKNILTMMKEDSITKGLESLGVDVTNSDVYDMLFDMMSNHSARPYLNQWTFQDVERKYISHVLNLITFPIQSFRYSIRTLIEERLKDDELTFKSSDNDFWAGVNLKELQYIEILSAKLRSLLTRLNQGQKFLLGITYASNIAWNNETKQIRFRDLDNSIYSGPDFWVDGQVNTNIYSYIQKNLPHLFDDLINKRNYIEIDMACFWFGIMKELAENKDR